MAPSVSENDATPLSFPCPESWVGFRLDHYLVQMLAGSSRSQIIGAIKQGIVLVNGGSVKAGYRLKQGDLITGRLIRQRDAESVPQPQPVPFSVVYEDDALLVINKPPDLVVHPGSGNRDRTLINGLLHRYADLAGVGDAQRPGIVHRLDKDTSGILVVARTKGVHRALVRAFKQRQVEKVYLALAHGITEQSQGRVEAPIGRHPVHRQKMSVRQKDGRPATSRWRVRQYLGGFSFLEVVIETGRTHQIRVHLASIGHPVAGDRLYGANRVNAPFPRQMLHSWRLRFDHPITGESMTCEAPLPDDFACVLETLGGT